MLRTHTLFAVLLASTIQVFSPHQSHAVLIIAEDLLVDISATDSSAGQTEWTNNGSLGGSFLVYKSGM